MVMKIVWGVVEGWKLNKWSKEMRKKGIITRCYVSVRNIE
jgi:hypothetical protein